MVNRTQPSEAYLGAEQIHAQWESDYFNEHTERLYELIFDRIVDALDAAPGQTVLDAGCGYGFHATRLARRGLRVTGVDFSDVALQHAQTNIESAGVAS